MKLRTTPILISLVALGACRAATRTNVQQSSTLPKNAPSALEHAPPAERLAHDVAWLADDAREGRRAGMPGEEAAARWIAGRFRSLGVEAAGEAGYFQEFEVPLPARDGGGSRLRGKNLDPSDPSGFVPLTASARGEVSARLVFRGYGVVNEERDWDDYSGAPSVEGAVVLIVRGAPTGGPEHAPPAAPAEPGPHGATVVRGDGWGESASLFHKIMTAKRHGASAVLIAQPTTREDEALPAFGTGSELRAPLPALMISARIARRLLEDYDVAALAFAKSPFTAEAGKRFRMVPEVTLFADVVRERGTARNVLARVPGRGGPTVVVGAHFDHLGRGGAGSLEREDVNGIHNGADDNASGTAVVLEMARRLTAAEEPPAGDVVLALWSGEELGLLGSEHWSRNPTVPLEEVAANINLDMVGRAGGGVLQILGAGTSPRFADWLAEAGASAGLELQVSLSATGIGGSDHQTFVKREIPALHFFSGLHTDYHKPSDDSEAFEAEGAARVTELGLGLLASMQTATELAFVKPEVDEDRPRGGRWSVWFGTVPEYVHEGAGLLLAGTSPGSPAERAGLMKGDVIQKVGDVEITDIHAFVYALQIYKPGDVVLTRYLRDDEPQEVRVTLATRDAE